MNRFARLRYEKGLTQQEVADGAGIGRSTVIRLEQEASPRPTASVANKLAKFYGMSVDALLGFADEPKAAA